MISRALLSFTLFAVIDTTKFIPFEKTHINGPCHNLPQPRIKECPSGWRYIERSNGISVCLKVLKRSVTLADAHRLCRSRDAQLFGIDSSVELEYVKNAQSGSHVYIGAFRRPECHNTELNIKSNPNCTSSKMFEFTDHVTNSDYLWNDKWVVPPQTSSYVRGEHGSAILIEGGRVKAYPSMYVIGGALCGILLDK